MIRGISEREENHMDALVQDMMSHFCDELCRHPRYALDQEELDQSCAECKMREFRQRILDELGMIVEGPEVPEWALNTKM